MVEDTLHNCSLSDMTGHAWQWVEDWYRTDQFQGDAASGKVIDKPVLVREPKLDFLDDGPGKPVGIYRHIGRRPILAVGNSDGDFQMLEYTTGGEGPRLGVLVHHDHADREFAYDRTSHFGKLDKALDAARTKGWIVMSMKQDWQQVYPPARH